jgi:NAD(P) transhydrogenase subunit alpha
MMPGGCADGWVSRYHAGCSFGEIIGRVPVILHTPLMSGSNFVHGIVLVGAMIALAHAESTLATAIGFIGVILGAGNAAGDVVTERMLEMFKSSKDKKATRLRVAERAVGAGSTPLGRLPRAT